MLEKEVLTKKQIIKIILPKLREIIATTLVVLFAMFLTGAMAYMFYILIDPTLMEFEIKVLTILTKIFKWFTILFGVGLIEYWIECLYSVICLYRNKYYFTVAPLKSKSKKEKRYGRRYYIEYRFDFDKIGTFKTPYGYVFYPFSKYDKMEPQLADTLTEIGEEFYLIVRSGRKKKIIEIFHKRLFDIQEYEYTKMNNRYYI